MAKKILWIKVADRLVAFESTVPEKGNDSDGLLTVSDVEKLISQAFEAGYSRGRLDVLEENRNWYTTK